MPRLFYYFSLRSRRLEVVGERENGRARVRHACILLACPFFLVAHYFQAPATQAGVLYLSKRKEVEQKRENILRHSCFVRLHVLRKTKENQTHCFRECLREMSQRRNSQPIHCRSDK